jgi:hypothetical protein
MDVATLAELLRETAQHHDHYEKTHPKHNWWDWYAPISTLASTEVSRRMQPLPQLSIWRSSEMLFPVDLARI